MTDYTYILGILLDWQNRKLSSGLSAENFPIVESYKHSGTRNASLTHSKVRILKVKHKKVLKCAIEKCQITVKGVTKDFLLETSQARIQATRYSPRP